VRTYQREVERQKIMVKKAEFTQQRLLFVPAPCASSGRREFHQPAARRRAGYLAEVLAERVWPGGSAA
jgi:ParB family chromosome partitioning protein